MTALSPSTYSDRPKIDPKKQAMSDSHVKDRIEKIPAEFPGYGYRRIRAHRVREGFCVKGNRIRRVMRAPGLLAEIKKAFVATTDSDHDLPIYPNLATDWEVNGPNEGWVADLPSSRSVTCFVDLAVSLDRFSRKVGGGAISRSFSKESCVEALKRAFETREPAEGCSHHSDRGVQYASKESVDLLKARGLRVRMSRKGNPYDNAVAESFMKLLKHEAVALWNYET